MNYPGDIQQNEVEALTLQDDQRIGDRTRRRDLISVPVLEAGEDLPQHVEHVWLVVDNQDSLRCLRVDRSLLLRPARVHGVGPTFEAMVPVLIPRVALVESHFRAR